MKAVFGTINEQSEIERKIEQLEKALKYYQDDKEVMLNQIDALEAELEEAKEEIISETKWADEYHQLWLNSKAERDALAAALDAFIAEATLLPPIADNPSVWSDFVMDYIEAYNKLIEAN